MVTASKSDAKPVCTVDASLSSQGITISLTVHVSDLWRPLYRFNLLPVALSMDDLVLAQLRDAQETIIRLTRQSEQHENDIAAVKQASQTIIDAIRNECNDALEAMRKECRDTVKAIREEVAATINALQRNVDRANEFVTSFQNTYRNISSAADIQHVCAFGAPQSITLSYFDGAAIAQLGRACPNIAEIKCGTEVDDAGMAYIGRAFPQLTSIDLSSCNKVSPVGLMYLPSQLTSLNLSRNKAEICSRPSYIKQSPVKFRNSHSNGAEEESFASLAQGCPNLTSIDLSNCQGLTDVGIASLAQGCRQLTHINLSAARISASQANGVQRSQQHDYHQQQQAQKIQISPMDSALASIALGCRQLTDINLQGCHEGLTDAGISSLAQGCRHLTSISLDASDLVTDVSIRSLAQGCPELTNFALTASKVSESVLTILAQGCPLITSLYCNVKETDLAAMTRLFPQITNVNISSVSDVTDASLAAAVRLWPRLTSITLPYNSKLSYAGITAIMRSRPELAMKR